MQNIQKTTKSINYTPGYAPCANQPLEETKALPCAPKNIGIQYPNEGYNDDGDGTHVGID